MFTMTYTNTLKRTNETLTEKVRVATKKIGEELIAKWNQESYNYCKEQYSYALVSFAPETKDDQEKLGVFITVTRYQKADMNFYDRN